MEIVRSFDSGDMSLPSDPERSTMSNPRSEGRGFATGFLIAVLFWTGVGIAWWFLG